MIPKQQCKNCLYRLPAGGGDYFYCQYILATEKRRPEPKTPGVCPVRVESKKPYFKEDDTSGLY